MTPTRIAFAGAAFFGLFGLGFLLTALAWGLVALGLATWLAFLIVAVLLFIGAAVLALVGKKALAHADPAGDLPAVALALDASFTIAGPGGRRTVSAGDFFEDYFTTAVRPDEVLVSVTFPKLGNGWGHHYEKFNRTAQAWAIVGVAAAAKVVDGRIVEARVGLTNMGPTPVRASSTEAALVGASSIADIAAATENAADGTSPTSDLHADSAYRAHLARVLTRRAVAAASGIS